MSRSGSSASKRSSWAQMRLAEFWSTWVPRNTMRFLSSLWNTSARWTSPNSARVAAGARGSGWDMGAPRYDGEPEGSGSAEGPENVPILGSDQPADVAQLAEARRLGRRQ